MRFIGGIWDPGSISALAALFRSLTGALTSSVSTWITQRHQDRRDLLAKGIFHREQLYSDFISESARAMADAVQHNFQDPNKLVPTCALLSRIRLSSSANVLENAERALFSTLSLPIRSLTLLLRKFSSGQNAKTACASSARSAALN